MKGVVRALRDRRLFWNRWNETVPLLLEGLPDADSLLPLVRWEFADRVVSALERSHAIVRLGGVAIRVTEAPPPDLGWGLARYGYELAERWDRKTRIWRLRRSSVRRTRAEFRRPLRSRSWGPLNPQDLPKTPEVERAQLLVAWLALDAAQLLDGHPAVPGMRTIRCSNGPDCRAFEEALTVEGEVDPHRAVETFVKKQKAARDLQRQFPPLVVTRKGSRGKPKSRCPACKEHPEVDYQRQLRRGFPDPMDGPESRVPQREYRRRLEKRKARDERESDDEVERKCKEAGL
jgi:hypothetical protein